jgi:hypothetical protein
MRRFSPVQQLDSAVGWITNSFQPSIPSQEKPVPRLLARTYVLQTSSASKDPESQALVAPCCPLQAPLRVPSPRPPSRPLSSLPRRCLAAFRHWKLPPRRRVRGRLLGHHRPIATTAQSTTAGNSIVVEAASEPAPGSTVSA